MMPRARSGALTGTGAGARFSVHNSSVGISRSTATQREDFDPLCTVDLSFGPKLPHNVRFVQRVSGTESCLSPIPARAEIPATP